MKLFLGMDEMKVFLDMDGVLVDFRRGVCEAFDRDDPSTNWKFWENWEGISSKNVDAICNQEFWRTLPWTEDGQRMLYGWVNIMGMFDDITILTTPMPNPDSWTGKYLWIRENMPEKFLKNTIMLQGSKAQLAGPGTLLIDDKDQNIEEFRAAGGQGILVPRPWNKDAHLASQTLGIVKRYLEDYA